MEPDRQDAKDAKNLVDLRDPGVLGGFADVTAERRLLASWRLGS
jgi:hypothetical protein